MSEFIVRLISFASMFVLVGFLEWKYPFRQLTYRKGSRWLNNMGLVFEIVLNGTALFNHANFSIPAKLERVMRWFVVTPDMHWVHHSIRPEETNSHYGFNFPWWDRLFGTYVAKPKANPQTMPIGIELFRNESDSALDRLLIQPFKQKAVSKATQQTHQLLGIRLNTAGEQHAPVGGFHMQRWKRFDVNLVFPFRKVFDVDPVRMNRA